MVSYMHHNIQQTPIQSHGPRDRRRARICGDRLGGNYKPGSGCVGCQIHEEPLGGTVSGWLEWRTRAWERAGLAGGFESCRRGWWPEPWVGMKPPRESEQRKPHERPGRRAARKTLGGGMWQIRATGGQIQGRGDIGVGP